MGSYERLPQATVANVAVGCADAATAVVSAAFPMGYLAPVELEGQFRRSVTVVACTVLTYAVLSLVNGGRVYPALLGMPPGSHFVPTTGLAFVPLVWSADPAIAQSVGQALFGGSEGWRVLCALYCIGMAVCLVVQARR